ncbi:MAG: hypothetical protein NC489_33720 [Ruminococcus flavefaciens]|nr:hypothetical protein [Ruminococcus flavefaciens]
MSVYDFTVKTQDGAEIHSFCTGRYGITFPQFAKVDVNGKNAIPLFKWLTEHTKKSTMR